MSKGYAYILTNPSVLEVSCGVRDVKEKDAVGRLWAAQDKTKYVYATIYKSKDGKSMGQQIDAVFGVK